MPTRPRLDDQNLAPAVLERLAAFHTDVIGQVQEAARRDPVVVVGMAQNPHVRNVRRALDQAGVAYTYLEFGSYLSKWRERLAIKLWSGWPTFPQVFVRGTLIGGEDLTRAALADGSLKATGGASTPAAASA